MAKKSKLKKLWDLVVKPIVICTLLLSLLSLANTIYDNDLQESHQEYQNSLLKFSTEREDLTLESLEIINLHLLYLDSNLNINISPNLNNTDYFSNDEARKTFNELQNHKINTTKEYIRIQINNQNSQIVKDIESYNKKLASFEGYKEPTTFFNIRVSVVRSSIWFIQYILFIIIFATSISEEKRKEKHDKLIAENAKLKERIENSKNKSIIHPSVGRVVGAGRRASKKRKKSK